MVIAGRPTLSLSPSLSLSPPPHPTQDGVASFTCFCTHGWTGVTCGDNINECLTEPCENSGTCRVSLCACLHENEHEECKLNSWTVSSITRYCTIWSCASLIPWSQEWSWEWGWEWGWLCAVCACYHLVLTMSIYTFYAFFMRSAITSCLTWFSVKYCHFS